MSKKFCILASGMLLCMPLVFFGMDEKPKIIILDDEISKDKTPEAKSKWFLTQKEEPIDSLTFHYMSMLKKIITMEDHIEKKTLTNEEKIDFFDSLFSKDCLTDDEVNAIIKDLLKEEFVVKK